jgi:hypothetical protein
MARTRSPNYPSIGLSIALREAADLWSKEKRSAFPASEAVKHIGFTSLNGTSRSHLAALKQYGLIDGLDQELRLTPLAIRLVAHTEGEPEWEEAVREAALNPKIFKELQETHPEASDGTLRAHLITKRDFSEDGAKLIIKSFRDTIRVAKLDEPDYNPPSREVEPEEKPRMPSSIQQAPSTNQRQSADLPSGMLFPLYLSREKQGTLVIPWMLSKQEWELLKKQVTHSLAIAEATVLVDDSELSSAPQSEATDEQAKGAV